MFRSYEWLFLVLFAGVCPFLYWRLSAYKKSRTSEFITPENVDGIAKRNWFSFATKALCLIVAGCLVSLTLMGTAREGEVEARAQESRKSYLDEIAFILDISRSMNAQDASTGLSRLDRAKEI